MSYFYDSAWYMMVGAVYVNIYLINLDIGEPPLTTVLVM